MQVAPDIVGSIGLAIMVIPLLFFGVCAILSGIWMFDTGHEYKSFTKFTRRTMKIEAVVVCVGYNGSLCWTLPVNRYFFDKMTVVTTKGDCKTQMLCKYWDVDYRVIDMSVLNKGELINEGLRTLAGDAWVLQLDADILLPPKFKVILDQLNLDPNGLYSVDNMRPRDEAEWLDFWHEPELLHECNTYLHMKTFPFGSRIIKMEEGGWLPSGNFHLWNQGVKQLSYPTVDKPGLAFAKLFTRADRHLLAEIVVYHLNFSKQEPIQAPAWNAVKDTPIAPLPSFGNAINCGSGSGVCI